MVTFYNSESEARADAQALGLREKVLCLVHGGQKLLVFDHADAPDAGVQVPAGGLEMGETPAEAAVRELWEESGLTLSNPHFLAAYRWEAQFPERFTRQVCYAFAFAAPDGVAPTWIQHADGHRFAFRWADLNRPELDWEMDAALAHLHSFLAQSAEPHDSHPLNRSLAHD
ncbi:NUDIX domain-containing protein [Deinococcus sp. QL22]|uniref:NUDIX domain-containing protein n=1 Tax=Deinococcus sp. QL22 TaxID=2939437 RepID=UPI0020182BB1|nr:NUDIX hydrolase [Deinococcus sp. QL22]UQN05035.1 NUDIX hydrolase [Deinococcus sp. QL22]